MENSFEKKSLDSSLDMSKERIKKGILLHSPLSQSTKTNLRKGGSDLKVNFEWDQVKIKKPTQKEPEKPKAEHPNLIMMPYDVKKQFIKTQVGSFFDAKNQN